MKNNSSQKEKFPIWKKLLKPIFSDPLGKSPDKHTYNYEIILGISAEVLLIIDRIVALWHTYSLLDWTTLLLMFMVLFALFMNVILSCKWTIIRGMCVIFVVLGIFMVFSIN